MSENYYRPGCLAIFILTTLFFIFGCDPLGYQELADRYAKCKESNNKWHNILKLQGYFDGSVDPGPITDEPDPDPPPPIPQPEVCQGSSDAWRVIQEVALSDQEVFMFTAKPGVANMDGVMGLAAGVPARYTDVAVIVRFSPQGIMDVRNGSDYGASAVLGYQPGDEVKITIRLNVPAKTYSVEANGIEIAKDYAFRTEQQNVTGLTHFVQIAEVGSQVVCISDGG